MVALPFMNKVNHISPTAADYHWLMLAGAGVPSSFASFKCFCNKLYYLSNFKDFNN